MDIYPLNLENYNAEIKMITFDNVITEKKQYYITIKVGTMKESISIGEKTYNKIKNLLENNRQLEIDE